MNGASFILAINLLIACLIAMAFVAIAAYDPSRRAPRWMAGAYLFGVAYYAMEFAIRLVSDSPFVVTFGAALLIAGMGAFNVGLARHYQLRPPYYWSLAVIVLGSLVTFFAEGLPRHSFMRMMAYQGPYFAMQVIAFSVVYRVAQRSRTDTILMWLLVASGLQFLSKPFFALALGGWGANPAAYLDSFYAMVSQSMAAVFAIAVALMGMIILMRDILRDATEKSETDTLSGLYNRRGFHMHASDVVRYALHNNLPVSLIIADLDHFKTVNDSYGHEAGDKVLVAFSRLLRQLGSKRDVMGRVGGEEFAVVLANTNLMAAHLFAEGARTAFAALPVDGLPDGQRFTASFGVAELANGESLGDLLRRADAALYLAKRDGRDCVRASFSSSASTDGRRLKAQN